MIFRDWYLAIFTGPILTLPEPSPLLRRRAYLVSQECKYMYIYIFDVIGLCLVVSVLEYE